MSNVYGDPSVANELLNGTTPWTLLDLGDSIANHLQDLYRTMFPARLPFGGQLAYPQSGILSFATNGSAGTAGIGTTLYCGSGAYSVNATYEWQSNGTAFGVNENIPWNRVVDGSVPGYIGTTDNPSINRATTTWGTIDWLAGHACSARAIYYGGATTPTQFEAAIRGDNTTSFGIASIGTIPTAGYKTVDFAITSPTTAQSAGFVTRAADNATPTSGQSFAWVGTLVKRTDPSFTIISASQGGYRLSHYLDTARYSTTMWSTLLPLLGVTHCMISLGQNEGVVDPAAYATSLVQLIDRVRSGSPNCGIILCSNYCTGNASPADATAALGSSEAAMVLAANQRNRVCVLKLFSELPVYAAISQYMGDTVHPTIAGASFFMARKINLLQQLASQVGPPPPTTAAGYYATQADVEDVYGKANIATWSQPAAGATVADVYRVGRALDYADASINGIFRGGPYAVPLVWATGVATLRHWAATLAGGWLYTNASPMATTGTTKLPVLPHELVAEVHAEMDLYRTGVLQLDCLRATVNGATAPTIVG